jgi:hypothetical protein
MGDRHRPEWPIGLAGIRIRVGRPTFTLRHDPWQPSMTDPLVLRWTASLAGVGSGLSLTTVDGQALVIHRGGVLAIDPEIADVRSWRALRLPSGSPGTAVAGPPLWVADDGALLRWTMAGVQRVPAPTVDAALALDEERILVAPRGTEGELALVSGGSESWRASGVLADACPTGRVVVVGDAHAPAEVVALDALSGLPLWRGGPTPHRLAAVLGSRDELLWIACADRTLAALRIGDGSVAAAVDTGIHVPAGALDAAGTLHLCHRMAWVTVELGESPSVRVRKSFAGNEIGRLVDPPVPLTGGRLLVRNTTGEVFLITETGARRICKCHRPVLSVAAAREALFLLEDDPAGTLCSFGSPVA